jgi:hypothetical protein
MLKLVLGKWVVFLFIVYLTTLSGAHYINSVEWQSEYLITKRKGYGRKRSWPGFNCQLDIYL